MIIRFILIFLLISCMKSSPTIDEEVLSESDSYVVVLEVNVSGEPGNYNFRTKLESEETGCDQYADWWEVITAEGDLIYRRNLGHSHVNEQPFSRSGGPVAIDANEEVIIRGHMNNKGYGHQIMRGSVANGFFSDTLSASFAAELENTEPLPPDCAF